eukprot:270296-Amphidinium_carterae.3
MQLYGSCFILTAAPRTSYSAAAIALSAWVYLSSFIEDFTRVLPWFDFAATILDAHVERRQGRSADADLVKQVSQPGAAAAAILAHALAPLTAL